MPNRIKMKMKVLDFDSFICNLAGVNNKPYAERKVVIDACPADLYKYCSYDYVYFRRKRSVKN